MKPSLPRPEFAALVHRHTGALDDVRPTSRGSSSDLTALVECEKGPFFVKAVRNRPGGRRDSLVREGAINPFVQPLSPALRWRAGNDEWIVLGFDVIDGRPADFKPGSADLPAVIDVLNRITRVPLPPVAREWPENRWDYFAADTAETALFRGETLLHTDINPSNVLIGRQHTWVVDWAWPTRGAAFIDIACLVVQLIASGHHPEAAEEWASSCAVWAEAEPKAVDAFAAANLRMYRRRADRTPETEWLQAMADAAQKWADLRTGSTPSNLANSWRR